MPFLDPAGMKTGEALPGWKGRFWRSEKSFAHYEIVAGASIHEHQHPHEEVCTVIEGQLEVSIDGRKQVAGPGAVAVVPPGARHSVRALSEASVVIANHPVRHDFL